MTTVTKKKLINGSFKLLLVIAFTAGTIVMLVKANTKTIDKHDTRLNCVETQNARIDEKVSSIYQDVRDIKQILLDRGNETS